MRPGVSGVSDSRLYKYPNGAHRLRGQMFDGESFRQSGEYPAVSGGVRGVRWVPGGVRFRGRQTGCLAMVSVSRWRHLF